MAPVEAEDIEKNGAAKVLKGYGGILVPGGFGERGSEGKILAAQYARENNVPYFGLCLGMQIATIEFARNVLNLEGAHSVEFDADTPHVTASDSEHRLSIAVLCCTKCPREAVGGQELPRLVECASTDLSVAPFSHHRLSLGEAELRGTLYIAKSEAVASFLLTHLGFAEDRSRVPALWAGRRTFHGW